MSQAAAFSAKGSHEELHPATTHHPGDGSSHQRVSLADDVDLDVYARLTPRMVDAELADVANEVALAAGRRGGQVVQARNFREAVDRIQLGLKREGRVMSEQEKRRVAFHESGHALVAISVAHTDPVHRVTIVPRSTAALGATLQLPTQERYLMTQQDSTIASAS